MLKLLGRLIMVSLGTVLAGAAAAFVLLTLGLERLTRAAHGQAFDETTIDAGLEILRAAYHLASAVTLLPALAVILIGEVVRIRSLIYYVLAGGAALAAIPLLARLGQMTATSSPSWQAPVWQVFATAGFAGGLVYWALAGRRA